MAAGDGKTLEQLELDAPPVWDGLAVANERIYVATRDGKLRCLVGK